MAALRTYDIRAVILSGVAFLAICLAGGYVAKLSNDNYIQTQRIHLSSTARSQASDLERSLSLAFTSTQILAHQIEMDNGDARLFESYAQNIMDSIGGIQNIQLAPKK